MCKTRSVVCPVCNKTYNVTDKDELSYSVCPYCQWELDPNVTIDTDYSSANKCTIAEAKSHLKTKENNTNTNRCVMCGKEIPDGSMVCYLCNKKITG